MTFYWLLIDLKIKNIILNYKNYEIKKALLNYILIDKHSIII